MPDYLSLNFKTLDVGAADKAAIQRVKFPPSQLFAPDTQRCHQPSYAWCKQPGRLEAFDSSGKRATVSN